MTRKIILHCGAPKTGSTSFQHLLYGNHDALIAAGFYCPAVSRKKRPEDDIRLLLGEILRSGNSSPAFIDRIRTVIERLYAESGAHTLIISNEGMLGKPFAKKYPKFYQRAEAHAERISHALRGYDVEARFVIRDYSGFLPSWFVQQIRMGAKFTMEEFLEEYDFSSMTWTTAADALRRNFDPEKVGIYDHADLVKDPYGFLCAVFPDVMQALGENGRKLPNKNTSIGEGMVDMYRRWNRLAHKITWNYRSWRTVQHIGRRYGLLPFERFSNSEKVRLPKDVAAELKARYAADLEVIQPRRVG
ncbi:hypothetical protein JJB09_14035 [Rhizobium sp. KVB221]|uniref:Sulfotransferase n=1 Tax=Rhizobium setariae TaxID=2801340 RepID=A0A936YRB6_9HYPH|nr:hypothetical protein [Rhizobium setariae]MBL0373151.1 hypothetical protein [Rhizobium setariae]